MDGVVVLVILVAVVVGVVAVLVGVDRYRTRDRSGFSMPTSEVHLDPVTQARQRVYVDPVTGARSYVDEPVPLPGSPIPPLERPGLLYPPPVPPGLGGPPRGLTAPPPPDV